MGKSSVWTNVCTNECNLPTYAGRDLEQIMSTIDFYEPPKPLKERLRLKLKGWLLK